jgi:hypothetical protein
MMRSSRRRARDQQKYHYKMDVMLREAAKGIAVGCFDLSLPSHGSLDSIFAEGDNTFSIMRGWVSRRQRLRPHIIEGQPVHVFATPQRLRQTTQNALLGH